MYQVKSSLVMARNDKGNTPLHCAAGAGNDAMVACIIALAARWRTRNKSGETALHQAVRAGSKAAMDELMSVDPELASVPREGEVGNITSPLYLARRIWRGI
nr:unnamed protein product [Digitaria exilis]